MTSDAVSAIRLVTPISEDALNELGNILVRSYDKFDTYRNLFHSHGISRGQLLNDPLASLQKLPLLEGDAFNELVEESIRVDEHIIDMETSSGTTGPRKRRFISYDDDASETEFLAELFAVCGINTADSVACLDADPLTLMTSFTKALDSLGVEEAYAYCVGSDFDQMLASLPKLDPSVIICIPSILERCFEPLKRHYQNRTNHRLSKVIYVGEALSEHLRARMESELGVEIFGYYGASETSALGIECRAHEGIHLLTNRNVIEIVADSTSDSTGEIVVTTLRQQTLPLVRYALKDIISIKEGKCSCGLGYPRVDVLGRKGDSFSILGAKFYYEPILKACYNGQDGVPSMRLILTCEERDNIEIVLPKSLERHEKNIKDAIFKSQPDLDFLSGSKYLDIQFSFQDENWFLDSRKPKRIVDLR